VKKAVLFAVLSGFMVAVTIGLIGLWSFHHDNAPTSRLASTITLCLWPTVLLVIDADENQRGFIFFIVSAVANGILYGILAFVITA
jgi:hypothetical protein